ncbi:ABC transporter substrate-binding protein [uncultured Nonlabens sp.]|uniref:ABC transporter substrate-binding protein n=1 Tax=uncultured Nonlabens sp. TaxID=859306 RepID=UPI002621F205|nr:ABC transporter substrate-binding protein [uncultured Nonlabens sp.]
MKKIVFYIIATCTILQSCKNVEHHRENTSKRSNLSALEHIEVKYAQGFHIQSTDTGYYVTIVNPWPDSEVNYLFKLVQNKDSELITEPDAPVTIQIPIDKIVATSTTHIPPLVLLKQEKSLIGFPSSDYISSPEVRSLIESGHVEELGTNNLMNVEATIILEPDMVMGFSIDDSNPTYQKIQKAGVPVMYNGEWVEEHPLGKAEWIKLFGVLYGKEKEADSIFNSIEKEYLKTLELVKTEDKPQVLSGATWKDTWYLPYGNSWQGKILNDAGANYIYKDSQGSGSLAYSIEKVLTDGRDAQYWIAPGQYSSYSKMLTDNKSYGLFDAFKNKQIYTHALTLGEKGGVTYYEEASMRPDLVLKDLVKILHPKLELDHELYFFKPLED